MSELTDINASNFEECIKCTICTAYCPLTPVNPAYPGPKQAGPDGERYRLKDAHFYDEALKYCLNCKRCEVACPSNVKVGDIIQAARIKYGKSSPKLRDRILASTDLMGTLANRFAPVVNATVKLTPVKKIMDATLKIDSHRTFPAYTSQKFTTWFKRHAAEAQGQYAEKVAYFHGCYAQYNYPQLGKDFVKVANAMGIGVELLDKERCCGVAKIANGLTGSARKDAMTNIGSFRRKLSQPGIEAIVSTSSTCVFTMRDEYPHLLDVDNADVRDRLTLASRFIVRRLERGDIKLRFRPDFHMRIVYHAPCHLEKLGWDIYTVRLLKMIPGVELTVLPSSCCGMAGTYGFKKENYEYSTAIGQPLFDEIARAGADAVVTDCETCKWQIEMMTGATVLNPISLLAQAIEP